tara:strand:- start:245 stop:445 length:201 start_codon:yes stop_codon:yes gene_type:complete
MYVYILNYEDQRLEIIYIPELNNNIEEVESILQDDYNYSLNNIDYMVSKHDQLYIHNSKSFKNLEL